MACGCRARNKIYYRCSVPLVRHPSLTSRNANGKGGREGARRQGRGERQDEVRLNPRVLGNNSETRTGTDNEVATFKIHATKLRVEARSEAKEERKTENENCEISMCSSK